MVVGLAVLSALPKPESVSAQQDGPPGVLEGRRPALDVNRAEFPDASLVDFSCLLDGPTGTHGFLFVGGDGQFYFEDGTRGRFWGINVAKSAVFQPPERIDAAVEAIARAGFNLVRLHHIDGVTGLLPPERAGTEHPLDLEKLTAVDHWIARLGERGIYVYLDLLDFRTFAEREGAPEAANLGRGAKPYAVFNERLIELQMEYARRLLVEHVNSETGLSYAQDPTVCMIELCDENGLFQAQERGKRLVSPYHEELTRRWNFWLRARYGDSVTLRMAWTDWRERCALREDEVLEEGTVSLNPQEGADGRLPTPERAAGRAPGRMNDLALFLNSIHRDYFAQMKHFLRERGVRVPVTAVTAFDCLPDLRAVYDELDFIGANFYYDHPQLRDNEWRLPMYFVNRSPLGEHNAEGFVPSIAASAFAGRPIVMREWGICWPNKFRAAGMLEAIAYAALQDVDAMIMFTYDTRPEVERLDFFDVRRDPLRWGLASLGAHTFLKRDIARAHRSISVGFSYVDSFFAGKDGAATQLCKAGHVAGIRGRFFDDQFRDEVDLVVSSGLSSGAAYPGQRAVISAENRAEDLLDHGHSTTLVERSGYQVATVPAGRTLFTWGGTLMGPGTEAERATHPGFSLPDVEQQGLRPIGRGSEGQRCLGFRDVSRQVWGFHALEPEDKLRVALDALGQLYDERISHAYVDRRRYVSDTRQIVRVEDAELLRVNAPTFQALAGALANAEAGAPGELTVDTNTPIGAICWLSLDGKSAKESEHWLLKMVSIAINTGEEKSIHVGEAERAIFALTAVGTAPIRTLGKVSERGTTVALAGAEVAWVGLFNGCWELVREGDEYYFYCDTPGTPLRLAGKDEWRVSVFSGEGEPSELTAAGELKYPDGAVFVRLR